jgi:hypothetical protein
LHFILDQDQLALTKKTNGMAGIELVVPNAKGDIERYLIRENSNFDAELQEQYPDII